MKCLFCGEPELVQIFEIYADGEFQLETCCGDMHDAVNEHLAELDPKAAARWLETLGHGGLVDAEGKPEPILPAMYPQGLRRVVDDGGNEREGGQLLLDWNLQLRPIVQRDAKAFVSTHHRHNKPPAGWRFGKAVTNGSQTIAVAMVGRPVSRQLDHEQIVEVNRCCVRTDVSRALVWNACSMLYGWAAKEAKRRGYRKIVTYTRDDEDGTSLLAAGWKPEHKTRAENWDRPSRSRGAGEAIGKTRWARELRAANQGARP